MTSTPRKRLLPARLGLALLLLGSLAGCAGHLAYRDAQQLLADGEPAAGIAKLQEAVAADPRNTEYRVTLIRERTASIELALAQAGQAIAEQQWERADAAYRRVLAIDAQHLMARQGLDQMERQRRQAEAIAEAERLLVLGDAQSLSTAAEQVRGLLLESPFHPAALRLRGQVEEARSKVLKAKGSLGAGFQKPVSLDLRDAPLSSVLSLLSQASGLQFMVDPEVRSDARASLTVRDVTVESALNVVLAGLQLRQRVLSDSAVLIYPNTPQKLRDYQSQVLRTFYVTNADVKVVSNAIRTLVKSQDLVIDERLGLIMMRDSPEAVQLAEQVVALHDVVDPEVVLEVEVLEVKRSRLLELGVQWPTQVGLSPLVAQDAALTLSTLRHLRPATTKVTLGSATLNAHQDDQDVSILANPRIRVKNKERAKISIGDRVPVISTTATSLAVSETVSYLDVGLKLEVEPLIHASDEVGIKVNLEVSNLVREVVSKSGTLSFQIGSRTAGTHLRLRNGETQVLAGLISDEERGTSSKLPGVGSLPLLGRLFGGHRDDKQRSEILLSITPRVVRGMRPPPGQSLELDTGTVSNVGGKPLLLQPAHAPR